MTTLPFATIRQIHPIRFFFWSCHVTSSFWKMRYGLASKHSSVNRQIQLNITALGLRPQPHSNCLLLALFHIWQAKRDETSPNFANFLHLIKSRSIIEKTRTRRSRERLLGLHLIIRLRTNVNVSLRLSFVYIVYYMAGSTTARNLPGCISHRNSCRPRV